MHSNDNQKVAAALLYKDAKRVVKHVDLKHLEGCNVVITGATGLVGINLVCALIEYNKTVANHAIKIHAVTHRNLTELTCKIFNNPDVTTYRLDLSEPRFSDPLPVADCVIHAAGYGQPGLFLDDKLKTLAINTSATLELSSKLSDNGSFIFISTSELYNGCTSSAHSENEIGRTGPDHPRACYIEGKRAGEAIVHALCEKGISGVSARLALAYGPGVHSTDKRVLNQFIQKALTGTIEMLDDGSANRTYGYISDIIIMLLKLTTNTTSGVYNVGGKSKISIKQLAVEISKLVGAEVLSPEIDNVMRGAPRAVELNLSKIENEFKLPPIVGLSEGLKNTIEWIKHNA